MTHSLLACVLVTVPVKPVFMCSSTTPMYKNTHISLELHTSYLHTYHMHTYHTCTHLTLAHRYITLFRLSFAGEQDINLFEADTVVLRFLHTFLCSAPLIAVQLSFIVTFPTEPAAKVAAVVIAACVPSLIYGLATFAGSDYLRTRDHQFTHPTHQITSLAHGVLALWHICMVASRVLAFALFSCTYGAMVFVVVAAHWIVMFCMLAVSRMVCDPGQPARTVHHPGQPVRTVCCPGQPARTVSCPGQPGFTQPKKRWLSELPFESMASFGYIFVFFRLKQNCLCSRMGVVHLVLFHSLTWLENIAMVIMFFLQKRDLWYSLGTLPLVIGLPAMGVLLFLIYHTVLNPTKRWQHCVGISSCGRSSCSTVPAQSAEVVISVNTLRPSSSVSHHLATSHLPRTYSIYPEVGSLTIAQHPPAAPSSSVSGPQSTLPTSMSELSSHNTSLEVTGSARHSPMEASDGLPDQATSEEEQPNARLVCEPIPSSTIPSNPHIRQTVPCATTTGKLSFREDAFPCIQRESKIPALVPRPDTEIAPNPCPVSIPCQVPSPCRVQGNVSRPLLQLFQDESTQCKNPVPTKPVARIPTLGNNEVIPQQEASLQLKQSREIGTVNHSHITALQQIPVRSAQSTSGRGPKRSGHEAPNTSTSVQRCLSPGDGHVIPSTLHSKTSNRPRTKSASLPQNASHGKVKRTHMYFSYGTKEQELTPHVPATTPKSQTTPKGLVVPNGFAVLKTKAQNPSRSLSITQTPFDFPMPTSSPYHKGSSSPYHHHGLVTPTRIAWVPRPRSLGHSLLCDDDVDMPLWLEEPSHTSSVPPATHTVFRIPPQNASTSEV